MGEENTFTCSICGLSSNQMGPCPACGSEIQNPNSNIMGADSNQSIVLDYGINFSPKVVRLENVLYGLDYAPEN